MEVVQEVSLQFVIDFSFTSLSHQKEINGNSPEGTLAIQEKNQNPKEVYKIPKAPSRVHE